MTKTWLVEHRIPQSPQAGIIAIIIDAMRRAHQSSKRARVKQQVPPAPKTAQQEARCYISWIAARTDFPRGFHRFSRAVYKMAFPPIELYLYFHAYVSCNACQPAIVDFFLISEFCRYKFKFLNYNFVNMIYYEYVTVTNT